MTANPMSPGERALKACAHCGGEAMLHRPAGAVWVSCRSCGLSTMRFHSRKQAIAAWNRRAAPDAEAVRDAEDAARSVLRVLAVQFDEMAQAAEQEGEYSRRDCWRDAASQSRARCKHADWLRAAIDAARGALPGEGK